MSTRPLLIATAGSALLVLAGLATAAALVVVAGVVALDVCAVAFAIAAERPPVGLGTDTEPAAQPAQP